MKTFKKITLATTVLILFLACEDNDKDPLNLNDTTHAPYVKLEISSPVLDVTDLAGSAFEGTLIAPADNVSSWTTSVRRISEGESTQFGTVATVNSFPSEISITAEDIATAIGQQISDFLPGDRFEFSATSTGTDGSELNFSTLSSNIAGQPEQRQAYSFETFVSCPLDPDLVEGTYSVEALGFAGCFSETTETRQVINGPEDNQITIVNGTFPESGGEDLILNIDPNSGSVSLGNSNKFSFRPDNTCVTGAEDKYGSASGFFFSCTGTISITVDFTAFAGNPHTFNLQKN